MNGRVRRLVAMTAIASLAVLVPMPSAAAGVHQGRFRGETEQARKIAFRVNRQEEITFLRVVIEVPGPSGCVVGWDATDVDEPIAKDGTFVIRGEENRDTLVVRGEFVSRRKAEAPRRRSWSVPARAGRRSPGSRPGCSSTHSIGGVRKAATSRSS
jgi:hypothetical protein